MAHLEKRVREQEDEIVCLKGALADVLRRVGQVESTRSKKFYNYCINTSCKDNILREKSLATYFEDSQFRKNRTFNFIVSKIYVDKRSRVR